MGNNEAGTTEDSGTGKKSGFHISKEPVIRGRAGEDVHKYEATIGEPSLGSAERPAYEDLGSLPFHYGSNSLFLIARDPHWLFSYWDIDWEAYPANRMQGGKVILRVYNSDGAEVYCADINEDARNWYVPVPPGKANFYAEIGFVNQEGAWEVIVRSEDAAIPSDGISEDLSDCFATVPYHLAFQKVLDIVKSSMGEGEPLLVALSRIQGEGRKLAFLLSAESVWTDEQRRLLAALLGNDFSEFSGRTSAEIDELLRKQLKERLFSESASGLLLQGEAGESSLFSAFAAFGSWKELSSWAVAAETSLLSSWLSSWSGRGETLSSWLASWGGASETSFWSSFLSSWSGAKARSALSSWLASWGGASETAALSSWLASWSGVKEVSFWSSYLSSWKGGQVSLSSWLASWAGGAAETAALSSWLSSWSGAQASLSSWLASWGGAVETAGVSSYVSSFLSSWTTAQAGLSSWLSSAGAVTQSAFWSSFLSSWPAAVGASETSAFWSSWLSSWPSAASSSETAFWSSWLSSWSGAVAPSSAFGSREFGASWSAQPFGVPREFFFNLNAEVVFYGGTHPNAKLWVDGKPVALNPDGTFRFHFKFPDGNYSIPIVVESPDGIERRSATLHFERGTVRYGRVEATPQPINLGEPFGRN